MTTHTRCARAHRTARKNGGGVGVHLMVEILRHAPADLTSGERLLLVVLAEQARDKPRLCFPGMDLICRHTGMTRDGVRKTLQRLAARDLEVRIATGKDSKGRAIYAHEGANTQYRIPVFATEEERKLLPPPDDERRDRGTATWRDGSTATDPQEAVPQSLRGGTAVPQRRDHSTALPLSSPQFPSSSSRPVDLIHASGRVKEEEEEEFLTWIKKTYQPRSPQWWRKVANDDNFESAAERWRAERPRAKAPSSSPWECSGCQDPVKGTPTAGGVCSRCWAATAERADAKLAKIDAQFRVSLLDETATHLEANGWRPAEPVLQVLAAELMDAEDVAARAAQVLAGWDRRRAEAEREIRGGASS